MSTVAVCVAAHERPARLARLLDALAAQARPADEVVVCTGDAPSAAVCAAHPLRPRVVTCEDPAPARRRNAAWRATTADVVAFTDDDCRPAPGWLRELVVDGEPAITQGATRPDPDEAHLLRSRLARSVTIEPPTEDGQTCNIAYPRAVLEATGGFDEALPALGAEDADLLRRAGGRVVARPGAVVWHAVEVLPLRAHLRLARRAEQVAVVRRGLLWKPAHRRLVVALLATATRRRAALLAWLPWAALHLGRYGPSPRGRLRAVTDLPLRGLLDLVELAAWLKGRVR